MANIKWEVGDYFSCDSQRKSMEEKSYGVVTSPEKEECLLIKDTGLRTARYFILREFIPRDAVPTTLEFANFPVRMALIAVGIALGKSDKLRL